MNVWLPQVPNTTLFPHKKHTDESVDSSVFDITRKRQLSAIGFLGGFVLIYFFSTVPKCLGWSTHVPSMHRTV